MVKSWYPSRGDDACVKYNIGDTPYEEFTCLYPDLAWTYLGIEKSYDTIYMRDWMAVHPWVPILACVGYMVAIVGGQTYFAHQKRWNWRWILASWNLFLSVFSAVGVLRTLPAILHLYTTYSWEENFCFDPESNFGSGTTGLWVQLFCLSKFPELLDTFFIVIHKKPLIFLHWYHHVSVLLYCWHSYVYKAPAGILFCVMNYMVHSIMYFYYFLMAVRIKPKWFNAVYITAAQITQMIFGVLATLYTNYLFFVKQPENCYINRANSIAALVMYGSYLFLFFQFFLGRYSKKPEAKQSSSSSSNNTQTSKKEL